MTCTCSWQIQWESILSGTCGMSSVFPSICLWITVLCLSSGVFELPHIPCSRITEQICYDYQLLCCSSGISHTNTAMSALTYLDWICLCLCFWDKKSNSTLCIDVWDASIFMCFDAFQNTHFIHSHARTHAHTPTHTHTHTCICLNRLQGWNTEATGKNIQNEMRTRKEEMEMENSVTV